jgi:hypothetical protein
MNDGVPFPCLFYLHRLHESTTLTCSIAWYIFIQVKTPEASRTMVATGFSCRQDCLSTIKTDKSFVDFHTFCTHRNSRRKIISRSHSQTSSVICLGLLAGKVCRRRQHCFCRLSNSLRQQTQQWYTSIDYHCVSSYFF